MAYGVPALSVTPSNRHTRALFALLALAWLGLAQGAPSPPGAPLERRYTAADTGTAPNHYGVLATADGTVYVANVEGILRYSAGRFDLYPLPNRAQVHTLGQGPDGRVYFAANDLFGYLDELGTGEAAIRPLSPRFELPAEEGGTGEVWSLTTLGDATYFQSDRRLYIWHKDGRHESVRAPGVLHILFAAAGALYVRIDDIGLTRFDGATFVPLPGGERFAQEGVAYLEAQPEGALLVLSRDQGFFVADAEGVRPVTSSSDTLLKSLDAYTALRLSDQSLAVATRGGELLVLDPMFNLIRRYRASGYPITALAEDREGGVWVATEGELVRLVLPSPWSVFTTQDGLEGSLTDTVWWNDQRWVSSSVGVQRGVTDAQGHVRFERLPWTRQEVWDLQPTRSGLLYAERESLNVIVGAETRVVAKAQFPAQVVVSPFSPDRAYVPFEPGFLVLQQDASGWHEAARFELEGLSVFGIVETAPGQLWFGNFRGAPHAVTLSGDGRRIDQERVLGAADGLDTARTHVSLPFRLDDRLYLVLDETVYAREGERFVRSDAEGLTTQVTRPGELTVHRGGDGTVYALTSRELLWRKPGERGWQPLRVDSPLARGYSQVSPEADGSVSVVTWNALLRYDPKVAPAAKVPLSTRFHRVRSQLLDGTIALVDRSTAQRALLAPLRSLEVEFGVNTAESGLEFRSQLEGLDAHFGEWTPSARREFANLPPGNYTLVVEARTGSGRSAEPLRWDFNVAPRWYQTGSARGAALLALLVLMALLARAYVIRRLKLVEQRNRELEALVDERTADLARANRQLARLATLDGLTGIANRRAFDTYLENAWLEAQGTGAPVSLLMMDVDFFKGYNDAHGHLAGDDMLRRIATDLARATQGEHEQLARYGGEEFALVLAGTEAQEARARAEMICARFRQRQAGGLTISIGVATRVPRQGGTTRELIDAADHAMYQAKHNGRARVEMAA